MTKKTRITEEFLKSMYEGKKLSRTDVRALERKGILVSRLVKLDNGQIKKEYKLNESI